MVWTVAVDRYSGDGEYYCLESLGSGVYKYVL